LTNKNYNLITPAAGNVSASRVNTLDDASL